MSDFCLEKWYMDGTDQQGRAFIAYSARLQWKAVRLSYNGYTFFNGDPNSRTRIRNSFSLKQAPSVESGKLSWRYPGVEASWTGVDASFGEVLLDEAQGSIDWHCVFPRSRVSVVISGEQMVDALGYVERIVIGFPPWKMPIQELHWGRFLSDDHTIVWIRWIGPHPKTLVFHNGKPTTAAEISTEFVIFGAFTLTLTKAATLRKGPVVSTVLSKFPGIARIFPRSILDLNENKWVSDGSLLLNGETIGTGKAIHECVLWP